MFSHYYWKLGTNYPLQCSHNKIYTQLDSYKTPCQNLSMAKEFDIIASYILIIISPKYQEFRDNLIVSNLVHVFTNIGGEI